METIRQRKRVDYNRKQKLSISRKLQILSLQIEDKSDDCINTIFNNQDECGEEICKIFKDLSIVNCLVYGMTQTGKTGCMTSLIQHFALSNLIPINNIYIITGLSDKEWKKDTKNRMPDSINDRVFHRSNLPKTFNRDIGEKKNILIIMDEIQIACEESQTIHKTFEKCGFYDLDLLFQNDIKLVQFSATPDGNIKDISDWKHHSEKIKLKPGYGHYGPKEAIAQGRVRQFKDLIIEKNVYELKLDIENFIDPRYHLIRVPNKRENKNGSNNQSIVISNFKNVFGYSYEYNIEYLKAKKYDINVLLKIKPIKPTFVFYCEILRCAKTQYKKFIGISYERFSIIINDSTILQGSFGRLTGYDDNGDSLCYTNVPSLENYIKLWESDMEFKKGIKWNTKTTNYNSNDDITYSTGTFNSVKHIEQLKDGCTEKVKEDRGEPFIKKFYGDSGEKDGMEFFKDKLKDKFGGKGPNQTKQNTDGFYVRPLGKDKNRKDVLSTEKMYKHRKWNLDGINSKGRTQYTWFPCYSDVNDPKTIEWWLIFYE
jgi:hypothetical protein